MRYLLTPPQLLCVPFLLVVMLLVNFISAQSRRLREALKQKDEALERTTELLHEREREYRTQQALSAAERTKMLARLEELNEYNRNILQSVNTGVIITDLAGKVITCNKRAGQILDISPNEILGKLLNEVPRAQRLAELAHRAVAQQITIDRQEIAIRNAAGALQNIGVSVSLLKDGDGRIAGAIEFFQDITEVRALRDSLARSEKLAALGRLAADIAHEVRNPLNPIRGFAQLIQESAPADHPFREYAGVIVKEVDRLSRFVHNVLDFSRVKTPQRAPVELWALIEETLQLARPKINSAGIRVVTEGRNNPATCMGEAEGLKQVFLNMIMNAADAMPNGGMLTIRILPDPDPTFLRVQIEDTGCGIPTCDLKSIFDPFFTKKSDGTGLGLTVSNQIVEAHGGRIDVESTVDVGTIFTVRLPRAK